MKCSYIVLSRDRNNFIMLENICLFSVIKSIKTINEIYPGDKTYIVHYCYQMCRVKEALFSCLNI